MTPITTTLPPVFHGTGPFRPRPRREPGPPPLTTTDLLHAVFCADATIDQVHDLTSLETATQALLHHQSTLLAASPSLEIEAWQQAARMGLSVPTMDGLIQRHTAAWKRLYLATRTLPPAI